MDIENFFASLWQPEWLALLVPIVAGMIGYYGRTMQERILWRKRELYEASIDALRRTRTAAEQAREHARLVALRKRLNQEIHKLKKVPAQRDALAEKQRVEGIAATKLGYVNQRIVETSIEVTSASAKLALLDRGDLESLMKDMQKAHKVKGRERESAVAAAEAGFINLARRRTDAGWKRVKPAPPTQP